MKFDIYMGVPEVKELWDELLEGNENNSLNAEEDEFFDKWSKAVELLADNPRHPGLHSHEISDLTKKYQIKIFEAYLENKTPGSRRMFWPYGPKQKQITVLGVQQHPNVDKKHSYKQIRLSRLPNVKA